MFASLPALAATLGGTGLLFLSWRRVLGERPPLRWAGWGLLLLALYLWVAGHGAEVGLLLGLFVPALAAWALVAWQTGREQARGRRRGRESDAGAADSPAGSKSRPAGRAWLRHLGLFLLCVPLAFGSTTLLSLLLAAWLPWGQIGQLAFATYLMPALWGAAAYWGCADPKPLRPTLVLLLAGLAAGLLLSLSA